MNEEELTWEIMADAVVLAEARKIQVSKQRSIAACGVSPEQINAFLETKAEAELQTKIDAEAEVAEARAEARAEFEAEVRANRPTPPQEMSTDENHKSDS